MPDPSDFLGKIPNDWEYVNAHSHLILESGQRPSEFVTDDPNDIPSLGGENISSDGFITLENIRFISKDYFCRTKKGYLLKNDIIINKDGANTGKVAFVNKFPFNECLINEHLFTIRNKGEFVQEYLFYFFLSWFGQKQVQSRIIGSAQPGFGNSFIKGLFIPKPSKLEQTAITSILSAVDNSIQAKKETIKKADRLKKALMQNLLIGKLKPNGTWRKEDEFYIHEKFWKLPKGWIIKKVIEFATQVTDGEHVTPERSEKGYYLLSARNIKNGSLELTDVDYITEEVLINIHKRCKPEENDLLISCSGTIGNVCRVPSNFLCGMVRSVAIIKYNHNEIDPLFFEQLFQSAIIQRQIKISVSSAVQPNLFQNAINKLLVILPPLQEQKEISYKLGTVVELISHKEFKLQKLERLKKSLMQNLLTGKMRVDVKKILSLTNSLNDSSSSEHELQNKELVST